jgi:hypothetical protein
MSFDIQKYANELKTVYNTVAEQRGYVLSLSQNIKQSLSWYTSEEYEEFNRNIRMGKSLSEDQRLNIENIDLAFNSVPPLKHPIIVYKGTKTDTIYSDKSFVSTTLVYHQTRQFRGIECCVLKITVSPGSKVLPVRDLSVNSAEEEVILNRDGIMMVTGSEINKDNMKILYATYSPGNSEIVHNEKQIDSAEVKFDPNLAIERIITFFQDEQGEDFDPDFIDDEEIGRIYSNIFPGRQISNEDLTTIKIRL